MRRMAGCRCRTGWLPFPRTAVTAGCRIRTTRSSLTRTPPARRVKPSATSSERYARRALSPWEAYDGRFLPMPTPYIVTRMRPTDVQLFRGLNRVFGEAFGEPDTYG